MRTWPLVLALAACHTGGGDDYAVVPGGPGVFGGGTTGGTTGSDGGTDDGDGGVSQRVCLLTDLRQLKLCAATGAGGLRVTLGNVTATTADDGTFTLVPPGGVLTWHVTTVMPTGPQIVTTAMAYSGQLSVPAITTAVYDDLLHSNSVPIILDGQGSLVIHLTRAGASLPGAKATLAPVSANNTLYDSSSLLIWNANQTGTFGVVWAPGVTAGTEQFTIIPQTGATVGPVSATIENQAITFVTQEVP